jgi:dTMP kinase
MSGILVAFEGIDGAGKSVLSLGLLDTLRNRGCNCSYFAFPGKEAGTLGKLVYDLHHDRLRFNVKSISSTSLQMLHVAAHVDSIKNQILPAMERGDLVILDRYWWSTLAYGEALGADRTSLDLLIQIEKKHWGNIRPEILFYVERTRDYENGLLEKVAREYESIIEGEKGKQKIVRIQNDSSIAEGLSIIMKIVESIQYE